MEKEIKMIGTLFGARILIETDSEDVARKCEKWMVNKVSKEEKLITDMAKFI